MEERLWARRKGGNVVLESEITPYLQQLPGFGGSSRYSNTRRRVGHLEGENLDSFQPWRFFPVPFARIGRGRDLQANVGQELDN